MKTNTEGGSLVSSAERNDNQQTSQFPMIVNRCSANQLCCCIRKMSSKQKSIVRKLGFGKILALQIGGIPQRLGHFVVESFDVSRMEIRVGGGTIKVDEESLYQLLGIPNSGFDLHSVKPSKKLDSSLEAWRKHYTEEYISPASIVERILSNGNDVSENFKIDFIVLFLSTMVKCYGNGKCVLDALYRWGGKFDFEKINWCRYVCNCLKMCKVKWEKKKDSAFKGGLTILTVCNSINLTCLPCFDLLIWCFILYYFGDHIIYITVKNVFHLLSCVASLC
jgi:hypothetical protein